MYQKFLTCPFCEEEIGGDLKWHIYAVENCSERFFDLNKMLLLYVEEACNPLVTGAGFAITPSTGYGLVGLRHQENPNELYCGVCLDLGFKTSVDSMMERLLLTAGSEMYAREPHNLYSGWADFKQEFADMDKRGLHLIDLRVDFNTLNLLFVTNEQHKWRDEFLKTTWIDVTLQSSPGKVHPELDKIFERWIYQ